MQIKTAAPSDYDKIYLLVQEAFKTAAVSDGTEQDFVLQLRKSSGWLPDLEFIAIDNEEIIGHIMLTRQNIFANKAITAVLVAPLCVKLNCRSKGIGSALMRHALAAAQQCGFNAAFLIGDPAYYGRFGFKAVKSLNIKNVSQVPDKFVQGCALTEGIFVGIIASIKII